MTLDIIIFIASVVFGISLYWSETKSNGLYRAINKLTHSKELQMKPENKKGFFVNQEFIPRLIYVNLLFIIALLFLLLLPFKIQADFYVSAVVGTLIGVYLGSFVVKVKGTSENLFDSVVDTGKEIIDDIKTKEKEAPEFVKEDVNSTAVEAEEKTTHTEEPEAPKKSARERLKDKGLLK